MKLWQMVSNIASPSFRLNKGIVFFADQQKNPTVSYHKRGHTPKLLYGQARGC